jgi:hypothetical protein
MTQALLDKLHAAGFTDDDIAAASVDQVLIPKARLTEEQRATERLTGEWPLAYHARAAGKIVELTQAEAAELRAQHA